MKIRRRRNTRSESATRIKPLSKEDCKARAMRGYWEHFPISPQEYASSLESLYKTSGWYTKNQSSALNRELSAFVDECKVRVSLSELVALYRAFLTVVAEKMDMVDDSYGTVGGFYEVYLKSTCNWSGRRSVCQERFSSKT